MLKELEAFHQASSKRKRSRRQDMTPTPPDHRQTHPKQLIEIPLLSGDWPYFPLQVCLSLAVQDMLQPYHDAYLLA